MQVKVNKKAAASTQRLFILASSQATTERRI